MITKRLITLLLGTLTSLILTQMLVMAQDKGTPYPTPTTAGYPPVTPAGTAIPSVTNPIEIGQQMTIHFDSQDTKEYIYTFQGKAEDIISISLQTIDLGVLDVSLVLPDQSEKHLGSQPADGTTIGYVLHYYILPADGAYKIKIGEQGDKKIALLQVNKAPPTPISFFKLIQGTVSNLQSSLGYQFTGKANQQIAVDVDPNGFIPTIELYCDHPEECNGSFSSTGGIYNLSYVYILPRDGTYILIASQQIDGGTFRLVVTTPQPTAIRYGESMEVEFSADKVIQQYRFQGRYGDIVQIHVKGDGNIDTQLALWEGTRFLTSDDDGSSNLDPEIINTLLFGNGLFTIVLRPYRLGASGKVTLSLDRNPMPSLDDGPQVLHLTPKVATMKTTFTAVAGEKVALLIHTLETGSGHDTHVEVRQDGLIIADTTYKGSESTSISFLTPQAGETEVFTTGDSATEISVEHLGK